MAAMMRTIVTLAVAATSVTAVSPEERPLLPIPKELAGNVERARARGLAIYQADAATTAATDALAAKIGPLEDAALGGYVALRERAGWNVVFFAEGPTAKVAYSVKVTVPNGGSGPTVEQMSPAVEASSEVAEMHSACLAALKAAGPFEQPVNTVVLQDAEESRDRVVVYILASTTTPDVAVLGKHYRVVVSAGDGGVIEVVPLSKGVIEIPMRSEKARQLKEAHLYVTNVLTEYPLESHVFASLLYQRSLLVLTRNMLWLVSGTTIVRLPRPEDEK